MRLLVYDPEPISHSTDVVRKGLLPELAKRVDRLVWMLPDSRQHLYRDWLAGEPAIELTGFLPPRSDPRRWLDAVLRRVRDGLGGKWGGYVHQLRSRSQAQAVARAAKAMDATWIFCPSFMNQPVPKTPIPLSGMIYDVSPTLSLATLENMDRWVKAAGVTFSISEFTRQQVLARLARTVDPRVVVVPLCPALAGRPVSGTEQAGLKRPGSGSLRVLSPAAFAERKGQLLLLDAAAQCLDRGTPIELVFLGAGTDSMNGSGSLPSPWASAARRAYQSLVAAGVVVQALGHVADDILEARFLDADVVVFPSLYEGFGLPVAEAVQRGLPVIASDLPPIREQLDLFDCHDRVHLVPAGEVEALAAALTDFAEGREPRRKNPNEMAPHFARWTWGNVAETMLANLKGNRPM